MSIMMQEAVGGVRWGLAGVRQYEGMEPLQRLFPMGYPTLKKSSVAPWINSKHRELLVVFPAMAEGRVCDVDSVSSAELSVSFLISSVR
jgi:hypothetical protein